jgi:hypothetical protein
MKPEDPGQPDPHDHDHEEPGGVHYFVPGQVMLQLEHPAGLNQKELSEALGRFIYEDSQAYPWRNQLAQPMAGSVLTFSLENSAGPAFSIVPTPMRNQDAVQDEQVRLLLEIYRQLSQSPVRISGDGASASIHLKAVSPNWLMGGVRHQIGLGSPGDWPDKAAPPTGSWPEFHLPEAIELQTVEPGLGAGVHVAILDTAPCLHDLDEAYDTWHGKGQPLIDSLLAPGGPLHVHPASYADLRLVGDYSLLDHRYLMADHGLFVAGIIHTLARQAALHLYEVLNPYGVGCVETIAQGLLNVLRNPDIQRPLIVNCSLVLDLPTEGETYPDFPAPLADPAILAHMRQPLEEITRLLTQAGAVIVAAAGNDASRGARNPAASRPPARYPAAFEDVIGVGAVSNQRPSCGNRYEAASYSNLADNPSDSGYVTLGGEAGRDQGMLGLFISRYPNPADKGQADPQAIGYLSNESGWARWAGTSFATPIVSGILAAWWDASQGQAASVARTILGKAATGLTEQNEKVIVVEQQ